MKLNIDLYADGAVLEDMLEEYQKGIVKGFTTNPSLMKQAGVTNYLDFANDVLHHIDDLPVSFEVFSDDFDTMEAEAIKIKEMGNNVFVKIPITNTKGESSIQLIKKLSEQGVNLNVTAILTIEQVREVVEAVSPKSQTIVSVFAGRVADTGVDPIPLMKKSSEICHSKDNVMLLWASSREVINIFQAESVGADIITCTPAILNKLHMIGLDHTELSLETVKMFNRDIMDLGFSILD